MDHTVPTSRPFSPRGSWRTYTTADGLAALHVVHIVQDVEGCLWFATCTGGVSRFDGNDFNTLTARDGLCSDLVYSMLCDRQGRIWFGTSDRGVCWYEDGAFHRFEEDAWLSLGWVASIVEDDDGRIWFVGKCGVGHYDGRVLHDLTDQYRECSHRLPHWGIAQDACGDLWFGGRDLVRYDGQHFRPYDQEDALGTPTEDSFTTARDGDGVLWVGRDDRLWRWHEDRFLAVPVPCEGQVRKLQIDREGRLWVCAGTETMCHDGQDFHRLAMPKGLAYGRVTGMCQDREGQFWFATWGAGVGCFDPCGVRRPVDRGDDDEYTDARALVVGSDAVRWAELGKTTPRERKALRIGVCEGGAYSALEPPLHVNPYYSPALALDRDGALWVGCFAGLHRHDGHAWQEMWPGCEGEAPRVTTMAQDADGSLYFARRFPAGRRKQLVRYDGLQFHALFDGELEGVQIRAILPLPGGVVWFGTGPAGHLGPGGGLGRLDPDGTISIWRASDGLADDRVTDLLPDGEEGLWIGTMGGLSHFDGERFSIYTAADGLPDNHVYCLCRDRQKRLWLGTDGALVVYDGHTFQSQWLPEVTVVHDLVADEHGTLWLATARGVLCYTPQSVSPRVRVHRLVADRIHENPTTLSLSASVPQLIFEYQGGSFRTMPREMLYTCRLQGYEDDWRPSTRERRAFYPSLPEGEYTFQVKAIDRDLNESEAASVRVTVEPDPHLTGLTEALSAGGPPGEFVGDSSALRQALGQLREVAGTDATVLILGETGTGKGLAARTLHSWSPRKAGPFIQVSCGALPEGLVESELFGHEKGAFTGALRRKLGRAELARDGTLFLDEIGDMPLATQAKLLRLLEEGTFERVGGTGELTAQVRVVAATNRDLEDMVAGGTFREDLFYRVQVVPVHLPPLRGRADDIPLLATYFMEDMATHLGKAVRRLSPDALALLRDHDWPGNVRELQHVVQRAIIACQGDTLEVSDILLHPGQPDAPAPPRLTPEEYERQYLRDALEQTAWVVKGPNGAAALLGMPESTVRLRMERLGLRRP